MWLLGLEFYFVIYEVHWPVLQSTRYAVREYVSLLFSQPANLLICISGKLLQSHYLLLSFRAVFLLPHLFVSEPFSQYFNTFLGSPKQITIPDGKKISRVVALVDPRMTMWELVERKVYSGLKKQVRMVSRVRDCFRQYSGKNYRSLLGYISFKFVTVTSYCS